MHDQPFKEVFAPESASADNRGEPLITAKEVRARYSLMDILEATCMWRNCC